VLPFNNCASGDSAPKAFNENPLMTVGKTTAGTDVRKKSLRFIKNNLAQAPSSSPEGGGLPERLMNYNDSLYLKNSFSFYVRNYAN
jgi:hypothetical protein